MEKISRKSRCPLVDTNLTISSRYQLEHLKIKFVSKCGHLSPNLKNIKNNKKLE